MDLSLENILTVAGVLYPVLLFVLPQETASKIDFGIKVIKKVVDTLEEAKETKKGLSFEKE
jgi:hypothetical protein